MELQQQQDELVQAGYVTYSISYDPVEVLREFAEQHDISYRLLSDEGSDLIRSLGLLNVHVAEQSAQYGVRYSKNYEGVAHPGTFILDEQGLVVDRWFEESYRLRPTGAALRERLLGSDEIEEADVWDEVEGPGYQAVAWMAESVYRPWMELNLHVAIELEPGIHVYAEPVPQGFVPLSFEIEPQVGLMVGQPKLPEPKPLEVEGLDLDFVGYEGRVETTIPITFLQNHGAVTLVLRAGLQTCTERVCHPPQEAQFRIPLEGEDHTLPVPPIPDQPNGSS